MKIKRTKTHQHLFLPKDYSGSTTTSLLAPWTEAEVQAHLATGWWPDAIAGSLLTTFGDYDGRPPMTHVSLNPYRY